MVTELVGIDLGRAYTINETCAMLDIHRNTLRRYTRQNKIKALNRPADNKTLYRGRDIEKLVKTTN